MTAQHGGDSNDALNADFRDFIKTLNASRVEFVLVGGYAVGVYGVIRATSDIDFLYRRSAENVDRLCEALAGFGAPAEIIDAETLMTPDTVVMFGAPPRRIDLLGEISGVSFDAVWDGAADIQLDGVPVRLIGLTELRKNKAATGRKKDKADLAKLPTSTGNPSTPSRRKQK